MKSKTTVLLLLLAAALNTAFFFFLLCCTSMWGPLTQGPDGRPNPMPEQQRLPQHSPEDDLADLLRRAAKEDGTVLMTTLNSAWAAPPGSSFFELFLEGFEQGEGTAYLAKHLLVVAMDGKALDRCNAVHPFCYRFRADGGSGDGREEDFAAEQSPMKGAYLEMMWQRNRLQLTVLKLGYNFLFTDMDVLWFRDPFPHIPPTAQLVMSSDIFVGDPDSPRNYPNGGLLYARSCDGATGFYEHWRSSRARFPGTHEQYVFDKIVKEGVPPRLGARVQFLDTDRFGGFCRHGNDLGKVCSMHANCCVGMEKKMFDLKNVLQDWKAYRLNNNTGSWRVPGRCIH